MSHSAQSAENMCSTTSACSIAKITANAAAAQANPAGSGAVATTSPRPPTAANLNADAFNPQVAQVIGLELPLEMAVDLPVSIVPFLALPEIPLAPVRVMSILIVDDVAMNRDIAGSILRAAGYEVVCVAGGAAAIAAIKAAEFDVVLMDVRMPGMDGLEATCRIRAIEGSRGLLPIVALTAQDFPEQIEECRNAGMNGHVSKPFDPGKLAAAVVAAMRIRSEQAGRREPAFVTVSASSAKARGTGQEPRVIDPEMFIRTAAFLAPRALAAYLRKITALAKSLLEMLDGPQPPEYAENEFAGVAHVVAGTAGMFGFERLTAASRDFERATECDTSEAPPLAEALSAAIKQTLPEIHSRMIAAMDA